MAVLGAVLGAGLAASLAACREKDALAPFTDSRIPPGLDRRFYPPEGWAWGLIKIGDAPAARYGVSAPTGVPRADLLILTAYGEPAEVWFETASALNARGYVVWVLEPIGQGGSGRYVAPRDIGHAPSLDPDAKAAAGLIAAVVRRRPAILVADGTSAAAGLQALSASGADRLILSAPFLETQSSDALSQTGLLRRLRLDWLRAPGGGAWSREGPDDHALGLTHDVARGKLRLAWQTANPDLRMGGPSWGWRAAASDAAEAADRVQTPKPVLVLQPEPGAARAISLCRKLQRCRLQPLPSAGPALELEAEKTRGAWLSAIETFAEQSIVGFSPRPAQTRDEPKG